MKFFETFEVDPDSVLHRRIQRYYKFTSDAWSKSKKTRRGKHKAALEKHVHNEISRIVRSRGWNTWKFSVQRGYNIHHVHANSASYVVWQTS